MTKLLLFSIISIIIISIPNVLSKDQYDGILIIGGNTIGPDSNAQDVEYFTPTNGESKLCEHYKVEYRYSEASARLSDEEIIVIGGETLYGDPLETTFIMNTVEKITKDGPNLTTPRTNAAAVRYMGQVFVCGGFLDKDNKSPTKSCEILKDNKWSDGPEMGYARAKAMLVVLGDDIFSIGGIGNPNKEFITEFYNSKSGKWQESKATLSSAGRVASAAAAHGDYIYICGGLVNNEPVESCIKLNKDGIKEDNAVKAMHVPRCRFAMAEYHGTIYAFGGQNKTASNDVTDSIEEYNPEKNEWKEISNLMHAKADITAIESNPPNDGASALYFMPLAFYIVIQFVLTNLC